MFGGAAARARRGGSSRPRGPAAPRPGPPGTPAGPRRRLCSPGGRGSCAPPAAPAGPPRRCRARTAAVSRPSSVPAAPPLPRSPGLSPPCPRMGGRTGAIRVSLLPAHLPQPRARPGPGFAAPRGLPGVLSRSSLRGHRGGHGRTGEALPAPARRSTLLAPCLCSDPATSSIASPS